jgi:hypothetical protein
MNNLPLEKQVCTLEQSRELAELLGENAPDSLWMWEVFTWLRRGKNKTEIKLQKSIDIRSSDAKYYNAYTGDELGALLPYEVNIDKKLHTLDIHKRCNGYHPSFYEIEGNDLQIARISHTSKNFAVAQTELLISLLKQELIKPEEITFS